MPNIFQKIIYNCSATSPILLAFSIAWVVQEKTYIVPIVSCGVAIALMIAFWISFNYAKKHLANISIRTADISPCDGWIVVYIITYLVPFANVVIGEYNIFISSVIVILVVVCAPFVNGAIPNPLLFARGYHFYQVSTEHGINYMLISKRKFRKKQDLNRINRIFEFLLLDSEGR